MAIPTEEIGQIEVLFNTDHMLNIRDKTWAKVEELFAERRAIEQAALKVFAEASVAARDNKTVCYYTNANGSLCRGYVTDIHAINASEMKLRMQDIDHLAQGRTSAFDKDWVSYHHIIHFGEAPAGA
jgi:hypothetical protein